jgi:hypothetical protein
MSPYLYIWVYTSIYKYIPVYTNIYIYIYIRVYTSICLVYTCISRYITCYKPCYCLWWYISHVGQHAIVYGFWVCHKLCVSWPSFVYHCLKFHKLTSQRCQYSKETAINGDKTIYAIGYPSIYYSIPLVYPCLWLFP